MVFDLKRLTATASVALLIASPSFAATVGVFGEAYNTVLTIPSVPAAGFNILQPGPVLNRSATYTAVGFPYTNAISATASARADLTTGEVGAYVSASEGGQGRASSSWSERVTIFNPNVGATDTWALQFKISNHGLLTALGDTVPGGVPSALSLLNFYTSGQQVIGFQGSGQFTAVRSYNGPSTAGASGLTLLSTQAGEPNETIYTLSRTVYGNNVNLGLSIVLDVRAQDGYVADFGNTAGFTFNLPTGATFTSESGSFLSAPTAAVPEPATWALMILGFGGAGAALRRRRRPLAV